MFNPLKLFKIQKQIDHKKRIQLSRNAKLDRVRAATAVRESIKKVIAKTHGVSAKRIVLMDARDKFIGKGFRGRYVIKNRTGANLKFNF